MLGNRGGWCVYTGGEELLLGYLCLVVSSWRSLSIFFFVQMPYGLHCRACELLGAPLVEFLSVILDFWVLLGLCSR